MRKSICNFVKWVTFGKVCLGWCVIPKEDTTPKPKRLVYTKKEEE
jgi:hypothetical protein